MATTNNSAPGVEADFTAPKISASPCTFNFVVPKFSFGFNLPKFKFPPFDVPVPRFRLAISCDLSNPIDVSAGLSFGGGRVPNGDPSPDDDEDR